MICVLKVVQGPMIGTKCWLKRNQLVTIGRNCGNDFCVAQDQHMSRNHLIVEGEEGGFQVRDVGSANGTYVNDSRVNSANLSEGDLVRAGNTVFRVELSDEASQANAEQLHHRTYSEEPFIPVRTLNADDMTVTLGTMTPETAKFSAEQLQAALAGSAGTVRDSHGNVQAVSGPSATENMVSGEPRLVPPISTGPAIAESTHPASRNLHLPDKFLMHFSVMKECPELRHQVKKGRASQFHVLDGILANVQPGIATQLMFHLVVNKYQLDRAEQSTLDFSVSTAESRQITETLYLLSGNCLEIPIEFYKRCLGKDAVVGIGTQVPLNENWLNAAIDVLSFPSLLYQRVISSPARAKDLLSGVDFLLFEGPATDRSSIDPSLYLLYDAQQA
ncbi:MAG: FHA domain-containing protein [Planctomycetales bacterium]|nr:FHA domain-containing protein [Planctomycetales bacterium]